MSATTTRSGSGKMARHLGNKKKSSSSITSGAAPTNETHAEDKRRSGKQTRRPLSSTSEVQQNPQEQSQEKDGATEMERELIAHLASSMKDCSRQRLRALQMALRRITNVDARISSKELHLSFQEQNIKINSRTFQLLTDLMGDGQGVQYDKLWTCLENAQFTSGRDSVLAQRQEGNVAGNVTTVMSRDERDADFTRRLVLQLTGHTGQYDLVKIRKKCQVKDKHKVGKLARAELEQLIVDGQVPVYGALLNNLLNRCDEEKTNQPSWPEFLDFLEQAHRKITGEVRQAPRQSIKVDPDQPKSPRPGTALSTASNASERTGSAHVTSAASAKRRVSRRRRGSAKSFTKDKEALDKPATDNPSKKNDQRMIDTTKDSTKEPIKAEAVAIDEPVAKETIVAAVSSGDDRAHSKPTPESDNKPSLSGPVAKQLVKDAFKKTTTTRKSGPINNLKKKFQGLFKRSRDGPHTSAPADATGLRKSDVKKRTRLASWPAQSSLKGSRGSILTTSTHNLQSLIPSCHKLKHELVKDQVSPEKGQLFVVNPGNPMGSSQNPKNRLRRSGTFPKTKKDIKISCQVAPFSMTLSNCHQSKLSQATGGSSVRTPATAESDGMSPENNIVVHHYDPSLEEVELELQDYESDRDSYASSHESGLFDDLDDGTSGAKSPGQPLRHEATALRCPTRSDGELGSPEGAAGEGMFVSTLGLPPHVILRRPVSLDRAAFVTNMPPIDEIMNGLE